jgi:hypothetical protein
VVGEADRVGGIGAKLLINHFQYATQIRIDFVIPKSQDLEGTDRKDFIPLSITVCMSIVIVLTAIEFDDEAFAQTDKVKNVVISRSLTAKMITARFP